jgi:hypothetical protein
MQHKFNENYRDLSSLDHLYHHFFAIFVIGIYHLMTCNITLYTSGEELPAMRCYNFFHSIELFHIIEHTPGQWPIMAVATDEAGRVVGHLMAIIRRRGSWMPPYLYTQGRIYGEGEYADDVDSEEIFGLLLKAVTRKMRHRLCFYIEVSDLSRKMFGYRYFRQNTYFAVSWQQVHNSLHSRAPRDRLSEKTLERLAASKSAGLVTREAASEAEVRAFHRLLKRFYKHKVSHLIPPVELFLQLFGSKRARISVTLVRGKVIGGCAVVFSEGNACLWYAASQRKRYQHLHPNLCTIWESIIWSWQHNYAHFRFLDAGLPFPRNPHRDFILTFGGKPMGTYRWFRFSIGWANRLLAHIYTI